MKKLKSEDVPLEKLIVPGEIARLARDSSLVDLRYSLKELGMLHPIIYRQRDNRLLTGRKRIASAIRVGMTKVPVTWVECDDTEAAIIEHSENAYRVHDKNSQAEAIAALVKLRQREIEVTGTDQIDTVGRALSAHALAVKETAAATGRSVAAVRQAEYRARKKEQETSEARGEAPTATPRKEKKPEPKRLELQKLGVEPDLQLYESAGRVNGLIDEAMVSLERQRMTMRRLDEESGISFWVGQLSSLIENLETTRPYSVCPYCKSLENLQQQCRRCRGKGWVSLGVAQQAPKELLDENNPCVLVDGNIISAYEATQQQEDGQDVQNWFES